MVCRHASCIDFFSLKIKAATKAYQNICSFRTLLFPFDSNRGRHNFEFDWDKRILWNGIKREIFEVKAIRHHNQSQEKAYEAQ